ncbi:MAG: hypothetical protein KBB39_12855 [Phycicoccus sp.]|nr:hypothetical protein [Phycicoccus sp.]
MPRRRVYVPLSPTQLDALAAGREAGPAPVIGYVAPAGLAPSLVEEAEHAAWLRAAQEATAFASGGRRVVGSADIDNALLEEVAPVAGGGAPVQVEIGGPIALRRFVAFHIDEEPGGNDGDLLWYDVTELADVRALLAL